MTETQVIQLPVFLLPVAIILIGGCWWLALRSARKLLRGERKPQQERDWSIPVVDADFEGDSLFHRWDVRLKIIGLLGFAFFVVATSSPRAALLAMVISFSAVLLAKLPYVRSLRRLLAISGFLAMFLVIMPLTAVSRPGDTLLLFGTLDWLAFNLRGLWLALAIAGKACAVALLMEPLLATASLPRTVEGLTRLGVPEKVAQMILLAHRYIFVFIEEARRMHTGMQVRGFHRRSNVETLRVMGNFLGMLFVRSFERTHRVYDAMQARGYRGRFPAPFYFKVRAADWLLTSIWLLLGLSLVVLDRWGGF